MHACTWILACDQSFFRVHWSGRGEFWFCRFDVLLYHPYFSSPEVQWIKYLLKNRHVWPITFTMIRSSFWMINSNFCAIRYVKNRDPTVLNLQLSEDDGLISSITIIIILWPRLQPVPHDDGARADRGGDAIVITTLWREPDDLIGSRQHAHFIFVNNECVISHRPPPRGPAHRPDPTLKVVSACWLRPGSAILRPTPLKISQNLEHALFFLFLKC